MRAFNGSKTEASSQQDDSASTALATKAGTGVQNLPRILLFCGRGLMLFAPPGAPTLVSHLNKNTALSGGRKELCLHPECQQ